MPGINLLAPSAPTQPQGINLLSPSAQGPSPQPAMAPPGYLAMPTGGATETFDLVPPGGTGPRVQVGADGRPLAQQDQPRKKQDSFWDWMAGALGWVNQGLTLNAWDEIVGAGGGVVSALSGEGFQSGYNKTVQAERDRLQAFAEQNPTGAAALNIGGAIATVPLLPAAALRLPAAVSSRIGTAGTRVGEAALTGAGFGAVQGFNAGEGDAADRIPSALAGIGAGAAGGAAIGAAVPALAAAGRYAASIPMRIVGGPTAPKIGFDQSLRFRAASQVQSALGRAGTSLDDAAGTVAERVSRGAPFTLADVGGAPVQRLLRRSTNMSPEGQQMAETVYGARFQSQSERVPDTLADMLGTSGDTGPRIAQLQAQARAVNQPAFAKAYADGEAGVWTPELEQLTQSPAVQRAIREATDRARNDLAVSGGALPPNPFVAAGDGLALRVNADGSRAVPTLQFWHYVQQGLDDAIGAAVRTGEKSSVRALTAIRNTMVSQLDAAVPSFQQARQGAAQFFGAQDALEAGSKALRDFRTVPNAELERTIAAMSPPEQALFREAYSADLVTTLRGTADNRNIVNVGYLNNQNARDRMAIILGPDMANEVEAVFRLESLMNATRNAVSGNSTTARQLRDMMAASPFGGAVFLSSGRNAAAAVAAGLVAYGARRAQAAFNTATAQRVVELLTSSDENAIREAAQLISRDPAALIGLRNAELMLSRAAQPAADAVRQ